MQGRVYAVAMEPAADITELIDAWRGGDVAARARLVPLLYDELKRIARHQLGAHGASTLNATALLHEALLKLLGDKPPASNREHFLAVGARAMRQVLIDHARRRAAAKRDAAVTLRALDDIDGERLAVAMPMLDGVDLLALEQALAALEAIDRDAARVVELRGFVGLTIEEAAAALAMHPSRIQREWDYALAWLRRHMTSAAASGESG